MLENQLYHIYNKGNNGEKIFLDDENYLFFLSKFNYYLKGKVVVYAYCLMPNHFHFLLKVNENPEPTKIVNNSIEFRKLSILEKSFRDFFISYSKSFNKSHNRTGSLFQYKFKRKPILDESYLNNIVAYIHLNPVRAGIVKSAENWNYSSYKSYLYDTNDIVLSGKNEVVEWFRGKENFIEFHNVYQIFQKERDYLFK
jgi:putative transposase